MLAFGDVPADALDFDEVSGFVENTSVDPVVPLNLSIGVADADFSSKGRVVNSDALDVFAPSWAVLRDHVRAGFRADDFIAENAIILAVGIIDKGSNAVRRTSAYHFSLVFHDCTVSFLAFPMRSLSKLLLGDVDNKAVPENGTIMHFLWN